MIKTLRANSSHDVKIKSNMTLLSMNLPHIKYYMLDIVIISEANGFFRIEYEDAKGNPLDDVQTAYWRKGKVFKRLICIPEEASTVILNFPEVEHDITIEKIRLIPFSVKKARRFMQGKLQRAYRVVPANSEELWKSYELLFKNKARIYFSRGPQKLLKPEAVKAIQESLTAYPFISIVMPVYNTEPQFLTETIQSVLSQSYEKWQLCIADDGSSREDTLSVLKAFENTDARIELKYGQENKNIVHSSNQALSLVKGDYIGLLDHDDLLSEHALLLMVQAINQNPEGKLFYSDENKLSVSGKHYDDHFKAKWNRDLLYSYNYISHFSVLDAQLVKDIGGFRAGTDGCQDYDLYLRMIENINDADIVHLPYLLYHWRASDHSTAKDGGEKSYTDDVGVKVLTEHFARMNKNVLVEKGVFANTFRIKWMLPQQQPLVSIVIPTRDGYDYLKTCIESIVANTHYENFEIVIVDNQSTCSETLGYFTQLQQADNVKVVQYNEEFNYSAINNYAVKHCDGDVIALVNNDIEVISTHWLDEMVSHALRPDVGCVGAKLYYPDDSIQHAGVILGIGGVAGHAHKHFQKAEAGYFKRLHLTQNLSAVTAACLVIEKSIFQEVNGLDEAHLAVAFNDVDFCLRVQNQGYRNVWTPWAELYHHESKSRGAENTPEKQARFAKEIAYMQDEYGDYLLNDPSYNVNLSLASEDYSLR